MCDRDWRQRAGLQQDGVEILESRVKEDWFGDHTGMKFIVVFLL